MPGASVRLDGWIEAELDGGVVLHLDGEVVPLRMGAVDAPPPSAEGTAGRAVRVSGTVAEPWHPRARPAVAVDAIEPWRVGGVEAPGVPPLARAWMRFRIATRDRVRGRIAALFPEQAGLVAALVLADRSALDPDLRERFARAGTAHLLAISGFHVGVLAGWVFMLLGAARVPRERRPMTAAVAVWLYVGILGFPTSAVRAAILVSAICVGRLRRRPTHPLGAWGLALALVVVADPAALRGAGAQLSFAGSLGLILWARPWGRRLGGPPPRPGATRRTRVRRAIGVAVAASAAAQIATVALVAWHFQRLPLAGLPASVVATPPIAVALPGIVLALLVAPIPGVAEVAAAGVEGLLAVTIVAVEGLGAAGGVVHVGPVLLVGPAVGAAVGAGMSGRGKGARRRMRESIADHARRRAGRRLRGGAVGAWLGVSLLPLWGAVVPRPLEIHLLDVGQGDAIAIRSPRGAWTLIDAGPGSDDSLARGLARLGVRRVETLVVTHPDLDHVGGAAGVVRSLPVGQIVGPGLLRGTAALEALVSAAAERGVPWGVVSTGDGWTDDGVRFEVIHAGGAREAPNDHSVVLLLVHGRFDALFTGDVSAAIEDRLPARMPPGTEVELLKIAHHGSLTSSSTAFLDELAPDAAVVSVGRRNRFGHPAPAVVSRLRARSIPLSRTDRDGSIRVRARPDGTFDIASEFGAPVQSRSPERR